ncbi:branched-chain amino acid ABC transporter permease [Paradesulfitobacterium ferrireducens]|uniref:branched-chain amino acid ABC transporter permease n=1 Tax=Paradesulfitobacterium ferrireducens TaxID=2816476 RepID=UPI001A8D8E8E|nr:branched-chain amino acid ABC transporter permease [Paradesulfitobacterium ferrireducens]
MQTLIAATLNGLFMGSLYGLIAVGLSLVFGVMKIINFAHGALVMVGMYAVFYMWSLIGLDPYLSLVVVVPVLFLFGYFLQGKVINPVLKREFGRNGHAVILLTVGLTLVLQNAALLFFGAYYKAAKTFVSGMTWDMGGVVTSVPRLIAGVVGAIVILGLQLMLSKTDLGKAIRATGQDREAAGLMGINDYKIYNIAFGLCLAILGIAAALMLPMYYVQPEAGKIFEMRSFVIAVLGGIGSLSGAFYGGLIVGLIESVTAQVWSATAAEMLIFVVFIGVLLYKPSGLLGK